MKKTAAIMWTTLAALVPGLAAAVWAFGVGVIAQAAIAAASAALCEAAILYLRRRAARGDIKKAGVVNLPPQVAGGGVGDGSALITGALLGLSLPPLAPWWTAASAAVFAVGIAKHCYGGLGANVFNPAMAGYAFALLAYPAHFAAWPDPLLTPDAADALAIIFGDANAADALTTPTPLDLRKSGEVYAADARGALPAAGYALGGFFLLALRIADWRLTASFGGGALVAAAAFFYGGEGLPPLFHILHPTMMLAAFFIVTDPATAAATPIGRWLFGAFAGGGAIILREIGAHPDGVAFAVLLANMLAPLFDRASVRLAAD